MRPYTVYCAGFLFDWNHVLLERKNRPKWQAGLLNAVGGHVEDGESPVTAMSREFEEETGLSITESQWKGFASLHGKEFTVHFFVAQGKNWGFQTITDEGIERVQVDQLDLAQCVPNLAWLIPAAQLAIRIPSSPRLLVWQQE